jgi:hypothetical protein
VLSRISRVLGVVLVATVSALVLLTYACVMPRRDARVAARSAFPVSLLAQPDWGSDAARVRTHAREDAARFAAFRRHTPISVVGPAEHGHWPIHVTGPMPFTGYLPLNDLVARVQRRFAILGTPAFLGANDIVAVIELRGPDALVKVEPELDGVVTDDGQHLWTVLRGAPPSPARAPVFQGLVPVTHLGARFVADRAELAPGTACRVRVSAPLLDVTRGVPIAETWPSGTCRILALRGAFTEILLGEGPYVHGLVETRHVEAISNDLSPRPDHAIEDPRDALSHYPRDTDRPELVHVAAGTNVSVNGRVVTRLRDAGYARVIERGAREARVEVTVTGRVVLHGTVPLRALGAPAPMPRRD